MVEVETINHKNHRSWLAWSGRIFLAVVITIIATIAHGSVAMALSNVGPSNPDDRYNMTKHFTHDYTELEVPVYFKDNPGSVRVQVYDTQGSGGAWFNGVPISGGGGWFTVGNFQHDEPTGYWKGWVHAYLMGEALFQFRLRLERSDGIIAYGTGRASQADKHYDEFNMKDNNGHYKKTMEMALPCSFTEPVSLGGPGSRYRLKLYDLDTWYPGWRNNNGKEPLWVSVFDESDGDRRVAYYDGRDPTYQCGHYGAGDEGVYGKHGCMGENGVLYVEMEMKPKHKYRLEINNVWKNNLIEYELPFDNVFYNISCEPNIDMRTTVDFTKTTNDPKKKRSGYKWLSSSGKYDSQNNKDSIAEVLGYPGANKPNKTNKPNKLWTWMGDYPHVKRSLPKAVMDNKHHNAELYPGDELTWWFRAYNVDGSGFNTSPETDFANYREGWIDPLGQNWNQTEPIPIGGSNWFQPAERGGPLNGAGGTHRQVMWGCYDWGDSCTDYHNGFNKGGDLDHGMPISKQEAIYRHYRYIVQSGDAGQTLCQWLRMSWNNGSWQQRFTPKACVYIPYHYPPPDDKDKHSGVVPTARVADGYKSKVQAGDDVQFSYSLTNTSGSGSTVSRQIVYKSYAFILKKEAQLPPNWKQKPYHYAENWGGGNGVGCGGRDIAPGAQGWCEQGVGGTSKKIYPGQTWPVPEQPKQPKYNVSGIWLAQPGDRICSYIAVDNNWSVTNDEPAKTFRASNIACVVVTKSPNLNLSGSDSYADKGFQGASVSKSDKVSGTDKRGSYSQYGLLTGDKNGVTSFGSAGYTTAYDKYRSLACKLSYANTGNVKDDCKDLKWLQPAGLIKPDNGKLSKPKWPTSFKGQLASQVSINSLQASGDYRRKGSLTITGGSLIKGRHVRLFVEGDVTISGDISVNEADPHNSLSDIPSLTVVAKGDIRVEHGVRVIAGTYVAGGKFESCKDAQNQKKTPALGVNGVCQNKLKVNGAIVSKKSPIFRRTFGAGNNSDDNQRYSDRISSTAEWIDYTPNLWLTTSNGSSGNQLEGLTTTQVTNLPVRY